MSFVIRVTETHEITKRAGKEWVKLGTVEKERDARWITDRDPAKTVMVEQMGYSPEIEKTFTEEREVFKQTVERLDLAKVIRAINGL